MTEFNVGDIVTEFHCGKPASISKIMAIKRKTIILANKSEYTMFGSEKGTRFPVWHIHPTKMEDVEYIKTKNTAHTLSRVDWFALPLQKLQQILAIVKEEETEAK